MAATYMEAGTDVNFGEVSRKLIQWLGEQEGCSFHVETRVTDLNRIADGWEVSIKNFADGTTQIKKAKFVFIGAGGGSLPLLQRAGVDEIRGYGGFPIGGQWLICEKPDIVERHHAKVYGLSPGAAPTMAVPHLDSRMRKENKPYFSAPMLLGRLSFFIGEAVFLIFRDRSSFIIG